jgi:demethoxyubiquinone hydroxylase (CLK1/Coq7/Cat5 family)
MEGVSDGIGKGLHIDTKTHVSVFICHQPLVADLNKSHTTRRINMPTFGSPFSGLANNKKLTNDELIRAVRFTVAAEFEATQLYMQLAESTDNKLAVKVLKAVADEERVHVGEFLRLLHELAPDEEKFYTKGAKEVEDIIKKIK